MNQKIQHINSMAEIATGETISNASLGEQQRAVAEVQSAILLAKKFPRSVPEAIERIKNTCTRKTLAETALYSYARGGTNVTGPSIRLAEAIAQEWGNIQFGICELSNQRGESEVEAFAWDIERNVRNAKKFYVKHKRHTKNGSYDLTDPRDIYEMVANQGARRLRACILSIVPGDVIEGAVKECETTLKRHAEVTPEKIKSLLEKFEGFNVTRLMIEEKIQKKVESINSSQMVQMGKIYNSLKDGMSKPEDWFGVLENNINKESSKAEKLRNIILEKKKPFLDYGGYVPTSPASTTPPYSLMAANKEAEVVTEDTPITEELNQEILTTGEKHD